MEQIERSRVFFREGDQLFRRCAMCNEIKSISEFYANPGMPQGVGAYCKDCFKEYSENKRIPKPNHPKISNHRSALTAFSLSHCSNCAICVLGNSCFRVRRGFKVRFKQAEFSYKSWYAKNADKVQKQRSAQRKANPLISRLQQKAWSTISRKDIQETRPDKCSHCGKPEYLEPHHDNYNSNAVRWLCRSCHRKLHRNGLK